MTNKDDIEPKVELLRQMGAVFGWCRTVSWCAQERIFHWLIRAKTDVEVWLEKVERWSYRLLYWPAGDVQGYPPQRFEHLDVGYRSLRDPARGRHWDRRMR